MTRWKDLRAELLTDPETRAAYDALAPEFEMLEEMIRARAAAGLSQSEVAARMGTRQSEVSRIEAGRQNVSIGKLRKYAEAVGAKLEIRLVR